MQDRIAVVFNELFQLSSQYQKEVPGGRRAWPNCIKERVAELRRLGVRDPAIAKRSGLPYHTIHSWAKHDRVEARASFVPMKVVSQRRSKGSATVTVKGRQSVHLPAVTPVATVTVTTPNGFKIEGLPVDLAFSWLERAGAR